MARPILSGTGYDSDRWFKTPSQGREQLSPMTWFETLTGFPEEPPQQVRENITVDGQTLTSHGNGKVLVYGQSLNFDGIGLESGANFALRQIPSSSLM